MSNWELDFWNSPDWARIKEYFNERGRIINPDDITGCLRRLPLENVRAVIIGQDPYADVRFRTDIPMSIPRSFDQLAFPGSLRLIFKELERDLHAPFPTHGDLTKWVDQGVLLVDAIPTAGAGERRSHDFLCYDDLTREVVRRTGAKGAVHCFIGTVARRYVDVVGDNANSPVIEVSSPVVKTNTDYSLPFSGSRIFSRINAALVTLGYDPVDWRL